MTLAKKSLGQHWLADAETLDYIVSQADLSPQDIVLEVGPGTGSLTSKLLATGVRVEAVEKDGVLAAKLLPHKNLKVITGDILKFDLSELTSSYKVVANIPYYLTNYLMRMLVTSTNPPAKMVLLVQQEVAQRICAEPGQMSVLAVSVQLDYDCQLGKLVPAELFQPPPQVDSQVIILNRLTQPRFKGLNRELFFQIVKAGFSARRKKLRSALAGGLAISKEEIDKLLGMAGIDDNRRAQELSLADWAKLYQVFTGLPRPNNT